MLQRSLRSCVYVAETRQIVNDGLAGMNRLRGPTCARRDLSRPADNGWAIRELMLLRLRALLAQTRCATAHYRDLVERYRTMATSLGYEGHVAWAEAMK